MEGLPPRLEPERRILVRNDPTPRSRSLGGDPGSLRMNVLLITGTDSGVGKTWVGRALGHALTAAGRRVGRHQAGGDRLRGRHRAARGRRLLAAATGQREPLAALHRYAAAIAPALAAASDDELVDLDALILRIESLSAGAEVVLIEGVGGLLSPITWDWTVVELARTLGAAALVVGSDRVGTISHALLTLSALELAGVPVAGVVLTAPDTPDASTGTNAGAIARLGGLERWRPCPACRTPRPPAPTWHPSSGGSRPSPTDGRGS
jgi:dethiobiotin synthase